MNFHNNLGNVCFQESVKVGSKILSTGVSFPKQVIKSKDIFEYFHSERDYGLPSDWMDENMGILERRMCDINCRPSDLAIDAGRNALSCVDINLGDIGAVIFCGIERDQPEPATAHEIQKQLGLSAEIAFDVANACFGFFDGVQIASSLIQNGAIKYALVTTGEVTTKLTREVMEQLKSGMSQKEAFDKIGFLSVGDAGAAMLIGQSDSRRCAGFLDFKSKTQSQYNELCYYTHSKTGEFEGSMKMARILSRGYKMHEEINSEFTLEPHWQAPDYVLSHQVGKKHFDKIAATGLVPRENMIKSYDLFGNTTSATMPINFHQLITSKNVMPGQISYGCFNGSGLIAGQTLYRH